jgi:hypothetical protein
MNTITVGIPVSGLSPELALRIVLWELLGETVVKVEVENYFGCEPYYPFNDLVDEDEEREAAIELATRNSAELIKILFGHEDAVKAEVLLVSIELTLDQLQVLEEEDSWEPMLQVAKTILQSVVDDAESFADTAQYMGTTAAEVATDIRLCDKQAICPICGPVPESVVDYRGDCETCSSTVEFTETATGLEDDQLASDNKQNHEYKLKLLTEQGLFA